MAENETTTISDIEWRNRVLCSDESCIGVIGPDGCCKECGKLYEGELPVSFNAPPDLQSDSSSPADSVDDLDSEAPATVSNTDADNDPYDDSDDDQWEQRTLCSDESCIGVIGPDGKCKECGKPGSSN